MSRANTLESHTPASQPGPRERRRTPRAHTQGGLYGQLVSLDLAISVLDLSFGGVSAELPVRLQEGESHDVLFRPISGEPMTLVARVAHARPLPRPGGAPRWVTGFAFEHKHPDSRQRVNCLIDQVATVLGFVCQRMTPESAAAAGRAARSRPGDQRAD
jgi:hypothetical protein